MTMLTRDDKLWTLGEGRLERGMKYNLSNENRRYGMRREELRQRADAIRKGQMR